MSLVGRFFENTYIFWFPSNLYPLVILWLILAWISYYHDSFLMVMWWRHPSSTDTVADSAFSAGSVSGNQLAQCLEGWCWWGQEWALRLSLWRPPPCLASLWSLAGLLPAPRPVLPPPSQLPAIHLWSSYYVLGTVFSHWRCKTKSQNSRSLYSSGENRQMNKRLKNSIASKQK